MSVRIGGSVFWDCSGTDTDHHIVEAEVLALDDDTVRAVRRRTWHRLDDRLEPRDLDPFQESIKMPRSFFDVPLVERLRDTRHFWEELAGVA
jgi:hypothetical protein